MIEKDCYCWVTDWFIFLLFSSALLSGLKKLNSEEEHAQSPVFLVTIVVERMTLRWAGHFDSLVSSHFISKCSLPCCYEYYWSLSQSSCWFILKNSLMLARLQFMILPVVSLSLPISFPVFRSGAVLTHVLVAELNSLLIGGNQPWDAAEDGSAWGTPGHGCRPSPVLCHFGVFSFCSVPVPPVLNSQNFMVLFFMDSFLEWFD